jgi:hypothetical protein
MSTLRRFSFGLLFGLLFILVSTIAEAQNQAQITEEDLLDCFPAGSRDTNGKLMFCEASAALNLGKTILIASDKNLPHGNPFFLASRHRLGLSKAPVIPVQGQHFDQVNKIEALAQTPNGQTVFASTAFDRLGKNYNALLAWPTQHPGRAQLVASLPFREQLQNHLGVPYFKIEGLMVLPGQRLVFGIRESGTDYQHFQYRILLVVATFKTAANGEISLTPTLTTMLDFDIPAALGLRTDLGISSLEFDPKTERIFLTTSHEDNDALGAYLWHTDLNKLKQGIAPELIRQADGTPLHFSHKAEGITVLDKRHLLILHDDDRHTGGIPDRQPHQAVYSVVELQ